MPYKDPKKHKEAIRKASLKRYHANPKYRLTQLIQHAARRIEYRKKIFELLGGEKCVRCGYSDYRALQIDHVNGGGRKHFKENPRLIKAKYYHDYIKEHLKDFQVLCSNCNWIKRFESKEVPNKYEVEGRKI